MSTPRRIQAINVTDDQAFAIEIGDESMYPQYDYLGGDFVICSPAARVQHGDDCFVQLTDGRELFRRVFFEGETIRLQPRNEEYPATVVRPADVARIVPAIYRYHRVNELRDIGRWK